MFRSFFAFSLHDEDDEIYKSKHTRREWGCGVARKIGGIFATSYPEPYYK
jgi:hypothetical protein